MTTIIKSSLTLPPPHPRSREGEQICGHTKAPTRLSTTWLATSLLALLLCVSASAQVQDIYRINNGTFAAHVEYHQVDLAPGKELVLGDFTGPGKVTYFYYTDSSAAGGFTYPGLVLKIYWDDATEASVQVPLWNFFGAFGHKTIDYQSIMMQINHYCYMSYLPMPFSKRARFVLLNDGDETYSSSAVWGIDYEKNQAYEQEPSRLHAAWARSNPTRDAIHPMLNIRGKGQYIGNFLQVNTNYKGWWGEGDTIFDVDGEQITHTPGTEDEYGSTWGFEHTFSYLYSGYIQMDEDKNRMYRWYIANPVRFQKSLRVQIENQGDSPQSQNVDIADPNKGSDNPNKQPARQDDYTSVVFWYQEGAHPAPTLPPYAERVAPTRAATYSRTK